MLIRETTIDDCAGVTAILTASYPALMQTGYEPSVLAAALPAMTRANPVLLSSGTYFVALTEAGEYAGCGGWTKERPGATERTDGLGHIRHFATHPNHTGKGIGRAIYLACKAQARAEGIRQFECYASLNAEGFYRSLGFEVIAKIDVPMGQDRTLPSLHMARTI